MGGSVPAASQSCRLSGASARDEARERGWIKEIIMDSAKDSGREMLAAINVEGSGFWLLFYFAVSEYKYPPGLPFSYETPGGGI